MTAKRNTRTKPLTEREKIRNRVRFREEVTAGLYGLLTKRHSQAWLARRLDKSPPLISKWLEGSNNFEIDTLADLSLALGRAVHIVFGADVEEMRLPKDEAEELAGNSHVTVAESSVTSVTAAVFGAPLRMRDHEHLRYGSQNQTHVRTSLVPAASEETGTYARTGGI